MRQRTILVVLRKWWSVPRKLFATKQLKHCIYVRGMNRLFYCINQTQNYQSIVFFSFANSAQYIFDHGVYTRYGELSVLRITSALPSIAVFVSWWLCLPGLSWRRCFILSAAAPRAPITTRVLLCYYHFFTTICSIFIWWRCLKKRLSDATPQTIFPKDLMSIPNDYHQFS